jgi:hypothetical protein
MRSLEYKHFFRVVGGKFIFEEWDMFEYKKRNLEGKRGYAIIEEAEERPTHNQFAYYFGGIIRSECMASHTFSGLSEHEVHEILFSEIRSHTKVVEMPDGSTKLKTVSDDFSKYKKEDMVLYLQELIAYLQVEYNIHPKAPEYYKYNKFRINPKSL